MKKLFLLLLILTLFFLVFSGCESHVPSEGEGEGEEESEVTTDGPGPAPNSSDGIPDGSGW